MGSETYSPSHCEIFSAIFFPLHSEIFSESMNGQKWCENVTLLLNHSVKKFETENVSKIELLLKIFNI